MCSVVSTCIPAYFLSPGFADRREEEKERGLTCFACSGVLQNRSSGRAGQFRAQDLRGRHGESDAQKDADGEAVGAYYSDGKSDDGGLGRSGEERAGAALPSGACDAEEGEW